MPRRYSRATQEKVHRVMREYKSGQLHSGRSHRPVRSRKQAVAIALSKARQEGKRVPRAPRRRSRS